MTQFSSSCHAAVQDVASAECPIHRAAIDFLRGWVTAWNARDAEALGALHASECVTVNRFGGLIVDGAAAEKALALLLGSGGPFGDTKFPPMELIGVRQPIAGLIILQATWLAPALGMDGAPLADKTNRMIMTYTLIEATGVWLATQIDAHNVEEIHLPYEPTR